MCGEHAYGSPISDISTGSSPRVRGTPVPSVFRAVRGGIIPACAGNTRQVHPSRLVGEGSSPRVRGTLDGLFHGANVTGIIPACAGNTLAAAAFHGRSLGSSPRVRGTRVGRDRQERSAGIIPACAGNTGRWNGTWCDARDHPRVCGEHRNIEVSPRTFLGSSPRVRGTRRENVASQLFEGIIPACAGNTACSMSRSPMSGDHPRVCGEHRYGKLRMVSTAGSSPRVRGTHNGAKLEAQFCGIIPACAGNTVGVDVDAERPWDHPRVCGEHVIYRSFLFA